MQRQKIALSDELYAPGFLPVLAICSACFLAGGLLGCLFISNLSNTICEKLAAYLRNFLHLAQCGGLNVPSLLSLLWEYIRWPLLVLLLSFTTVGIVGVPILFTVRGFFFAFSIASFVRVLGAAGCLLALALFGLTGLFAIPVFFVLGIHAMLFSTQRKTPMSVSAKTQLRGDCLCILRHFALCVAATGLCAILGRWAVPVLISSLAAALPVL